MLTAQFPLARVARRICQSRFAASRLHTEKFLGSYRQILCIGPHVTMISKARYLASILNSETARSRAAAYQARGQWGARHFDKVMFNLPIPRFDGKIKLASRSGRYRGGGGRNCRRCRSRRKASISSGLARILRDARRMTGLSATDRCLRRQAARRGLTIIK